MSMRVSAEECVLKLKLISLCISQLQTFQKCRNNHSGHPTVSLESIKGYILRSREIRAQLDDVVKRTTLRVLQSVPLENNVLILKPNHESLADKTEELLEKLYDINDRNTNSSSPTNETNKASTIGVMVAKKAKELIAEMEKDLSRTNYAIRKQEDIFNSQISFLKGLIEAIKSLLNSSSEKTRLQNITRMINFLRANQNNLQFPPSLGEEADVKHFCLAKKLLNEVPKLLISQLTEIENNEN